MRSAEAAGGLSLIISFGEMVACQHIPRIPTPLVRLRAAESTGRPLGTDDFLRLLGRRLGRTLRPRKPGPNCAPLRQADSWEWELGKYVRCPCNFVYQVNGAPCREYTETVYIDGKPQAARGTACRNPDGTWTAVS